ncbi:MAG: type II toxin-antitoxin system HicB family antitoxin [Lachnospiraceae bacterium]|nr:type II toxin-antitoxin system HicB family antitoxin [Lachnospiraceae bacterium]
MAKYRYPAIFTPEEKGRYSVNFPDIDGCYTCGDNLEDAIMMAEDVLAFCLYDEEEAGSKIPRASRAEEVVLGKREFVKYISCDTIWYKKMHEKVMAL